MITVRPSGERGTADFGWLKSRHTFSFGSYFDPTHVGFGPLRVLNEDIVKPGAGFDTHGHRDMEILSFVLEGALEHKDSTGTGSIICPGDIQRMTAGKGILHSEFNHSREHEVHFLQIWILPDRKNLEPGYEQKQLDLQATRNALALVAGPEGGKHAVTIHQDAQLYVGALDAGRSVSYEPQPGRAIWLQVASGRIAVLDRVLEAGDGAAIVREDRLELAALQDSQVLLFDLPAGH